MKVGTDGVLLGAWARVPARCGRVLDVGTGTGLIALMMAQRCPDAMITGIDIEPSAAGRAAQNAAQCPWPERLDVLQADALAYVPSQRFDAVVCNPPFFKGQLCSPDLARATARHTASLPHERLLARAAESWLTDGGLLSVVIPAEMSDDFIAVAWEKGLNLYDRCMVHTRPGLPPKRALLCLCKGSCPYPPTSYLCVHDEEGNYTDEYVTLTRTFYLHF